MGALVGPEEKRARERTMHNVVIPIIIGVLSSAIIGTAATFITMRVGLAVVEERIAHIDEKANINLQQTKKLETIVVELSRRGEWMIGQNKFRDRVETYMINNEEWKNLMNMKTSDRFTRTEFLEREARLYEEIRKANDKTN